MKDGVELKELGREKRGKKRPLNQTNYRTLHESLGMCVCSCISIFMGSLRAVSWVYGY